MIRLFLATILWFASSPILAEGFIIDSLQEAQKISESTNKPILVIFGTESCTYCGYLKRDILHNKLPETDEYIICSINIDKNENLQKEYKVSAIPDSRIFRRFKETGSIKGYDRPKYIKWLTDAKR